MAPKSMELKIASCKDLKAFNFFQKLAVYATVSIVSPSDGKNKKPQRYQLQKTPVDREGDGNPEWNHQVQFDFHDFSPSYLNTLSLEFDLLREALFGDKTIGLVRIMVTDLLSDSLGGAVRFVSYQVVTTDGKPNGVLDFSYKVIDDSVYYPVIDMPSNEFQPLVHTPPATPPPPQGIYPPLPDVTYFPVMDDMPSNVFQPLVHTPPATPLPPQGIYPPPPDVTYYPPPPTPYGAAFEDYNYNCQACSYPPLPDVTYYQPPPPFASVYPPSPTPYADAFADYNYNCEACSYEDTWRRDLQSWSVSQMRVFKSENNSSQATTGFFGLRGSNFKDF